MEKNAVGFFSHVKSGCAWYRIEHPMQALREAGITVHTLPINEDIDEVIIDSLASVLIYGAVPFSSATMLQYFKDKGVKIIYDLDDALDLVDITNPFYHTVKRDVGSVREILDYADHVTVATPALEAHIREHYDYQGPITVIPNCYDPKEWDFPHPTKTNLRIGFAGSTTHVSDLIEILPAIKNLQDKYEFTFVIMGFGQTSYEEWLTSYRYIAQPEATKELRKLDELLKDITFEWVPFVEYTQYPETLINLALDIGLCPLKETPFNNCRSASKAMEYNLAGALVLASDVEAYRNDTSSLLIGSTKESNWLVCIETAITHILKKVPSIREDHLKWIQDNRNIHNQVDLLKSVYIV